MPSYLDTSFIVESTLSADRRRLDYRWISDDAQGTLWYSVTGEVDSILDFSDSQAEGEPPIRRSHREIRQRSAQSLVITHSYRIDDEPWEVFDKDSVVMSDTVTTIYSIEDMETSYITRCVMEGSAYTCTPTSIEGPADNLKKQVWHLTGNRPDSLRTYFLDGRLESTEFWLWSPRALLSIRQPFPRPRFDRVRKFEMHNLLGRMSPKK
jgi:hypothetical protein